MNLLLQMNFMQSYENDLLLVEIEDLGRGSGQKTSEFKQSNVDARTRLQGDPRSSVSVLDVLMEPEDLTSGCESRKMEVSDLEKAFAQSAREKQKVVVNGEVLLQLQGELRCLQKIREEDLKEIAENDVCITKLQASVEALQEEQADTRAQAEVEMERLKVELSSSFGRKLEQKETRIDHLAAELEGLRQKMKEKEDRVTHLDQHVAGLKASHNCLKETLSIKEEHTQQLVQHNTELHKSLDTLQGKLQTSECKLTGLSLTLDQTRTSLNTELETCSKQVESLQKEVTRVRRRAGEKIQRRESKLCDLLKELTGLQTENAEFKKEMLQQEKSMLEVCQERDDLRARMEEQGREVVQLSRTRDALEADSARARRQTHNSQLEVRSRDQFILQLRAEMTAAEEKHRDAQKMVEMFKEKLQKQEIKTEVLHQKLKEATNERNEARLQTEEQKETAARFKQKYTAAVGKIQRVQEQVELLQEELRYSQEQIKKSESAARWAEEELSDLERRYQEKVSQWERSQEMLDQLTDELQTNQQLLTESELKVEELQGLTGSLQEQMDTLKQQRQMSEHDLHLYKQSHTYSNEEHLHLLRLWQQLQTNCTDQAERLTECEKVTFQMKSELQRQTQENADLKRRLSASVCEQRGRDVQLEKEVACLKNTTARLKLELADRQKVEVTLLRQSQEKATEARQDAATRRREFDCQRGEVHRLQGELNNQEENVRMAFREIQGLNAHTKQLRLQLEDQRRQHQVAVQELAERAEEVQRMERSRKGGELAVEKIRLTAARLEEEVTELRRDLSAAVHQKVEAERENQDVHQQMIPLMSELESTRSHNANLQHESSMAMENITVWIKEQKASNESLTSQMKAQNQALLINTAEKQCLREANDTLKAEVKQLKATLDEKERRMQRFKAQIQDCSIWQENNNAEMKGCVTQKLTKIEDMQTKLHSNLRAIRKLNQQLDSVSRENTQLRRQLEEETRGATPPTSSISARPLPPTILQPGLPHKTPRRPCDWERAQHQSGTGTSG